MSEDSNSNFRTPFLEGSPRIHYENLKYIEDEIYPDDGACYYNNELFNGIA